MKEQDKPDEKQWLTVANQAPTEGALYSVDQVGGSPIITARFITKKHPPERRTGLYTLRGFWQEEGCNALYYVHESDLYLPIPELAKDQAAEHKDEADIHISWVCNGILREYLRTTKHTQLSAWMDLHSSDLIGNLNKLLGCVEELLDIREHGSRAASMVTGASKEIDAFLGRIKDKHPTIGQSPSPNGLAPTLAALFRDVENTLTSASKEIASFLDTVKERWPVIGQVPMPNGIANQLAVVFRDVKNALDVEIRHREELKYELDKMDRELTQLRNQNSRFAKRLGEYARKAVAGDAFSEIQRNRGAVKDAVLYWLGQAALRCTTTAGIDLNRAIEKVRKECS